MKSWNFSFSFFFKVNIFFHFFSVFFIQNCFKIFFFSGRNHVFCPEVIFFVPKEEIFFFVQRRERFFLSQGGNEFFCELKKLKKSEKKLLTLKKKWKRKIPAFQFFSPTFSLLVLLYHQKHYILANSCTILADSCTSFL